MFFICFCESGINIKVQEPSTQTNLISWRKHTCGLGLGDISHAICMRISSVNPVPWLTVNLHHLFLNGAAFNTQSRRSLTSDAISHSLSQLNRLRLSPILNPEPFMFASTLPALNTFVPDVCALSEFACAAGSRIKYEMFISLCLAETALVCSLSPCLARDYRRRNQLNNSSTSLHVMWKNQGYVSFIPLYTLWNVTLWFSWSIYPAKVSM